MLVGNFYQDKQSPSDNLSGKGDFVLRLSRGLSPQLMNPCFSPRNKYLCPLRDIS